MGGNYAAIIESSGVEYSMADVAIGIGELIDALTEMRDEGATHVVFTSGSHRGARYQSFSLIDPDIEEFTSEEG